MFSFGKNAFKKTRGGVLPGHFKNTSGCATEAMPVPKTVRIHLAQHVGKPCEPTVKPGQEVFVGTVIGRVAADVFGSFVLNCGASDGVSVGDPVISGEYLIGLVSEVTPTTCTVLSVCDPKVNAAAYEIRTGETGYTETTAKLGVDGKLKLTGLSRSTAVAPGGIVCTSGVGGVYPRGLIIGTVTAVEKEEGDISYYAEVQPEIDLSEVQDAFVITDFEGKGDA